MSIREMATVAKRHLKTKARGGFRRVARLQAEPAPILFAYGGFVNHWLGMGRRLYESEPDFRHSVQQTDLLVQQVAGQSVLANFEGQAEANFFSGDSPVWFTVLAIQLALTDLWRAKGIQPQGTLGASLGEIAGVYAAGGLTRQDAVRICTAWVRATKNEPDEFMILYLATNPASAQRLCQTCPVFLGVMYEAGPGHVLAMCHRADETAAGAFLTAHQVKWHQDYGGRKEHYMTKPSHTSLYEKHRPALREVVRSILPQPLQSDYYSATLGQKIPRHSLVPPTLWEEVLCRPIQMHQILKVILADDPAVILQIGSGYFLTDNMTRQAAGAPHRVQLFNSLREDDPQGNDFRAAHRQLRPPFWQRWARRPASVAPADGFADFVAHLNLEALNELEHIHPTYEYLRGRGPVHYLPRHQAWLVLDYALVNQVLQQPALFSNQPHEPFDAFLIGADPPSHSQVRPWLQPLFSSGAMTSLGVYTRQLVQERLAELVRQPGFDAVEAITLPVAQAVLARFMGLTPAQAAAFLITKPVDVSTVPYWEKMESLWQAYLEQLPPESGSSDTVGSALMAQVRAGHLPLAGAVSIMRLMWVAGINSTSILLGKLIYQLLRQPELAGQLQRNPALTSQFVEEGLRLEPQDLTLERLVVQDSVLGGQHLPAGSRLILSAVAANRDPQVFDEPNAWQLDRAAKRHVSFGRGIHHCIGSGLARTQTQAVVEALLPHLAQLRLARTGAPDYFSFPQLRGLATLQIRLVH